MSEAARATVVRVARTYRATPAAVFDAWTSPEVMRRWWHAGPDWQTPSAVVDLRVGGGFSVVMRDANGVEHRGRGRYTVVEPPRRLAWIWEGDGAARTGSRVELTFRVEGDCTTVELIQSALPDELAGEQFTEGWRLCLDNLEGVINR